MDLSSREIALSIWSAVLLLVALSHDTLRRSIRGMLRTFFTRPLILLFAVMAAWTVAAVVLLAQVDLWEPALLKDTIVWFFVAGVVAGGRALTARGESPYVESVRDGIGVALVVEFLVNFYTFPLFAELALIPALVLLGGLLGFAESRGEPSAARFFKGVAAVVGVLLLASAMTQAWSDRDQFLGWEILRQFLLPILLSVLFVPMAFTLDLWGRYEWLFGKLRGTTSFQRRARLLLAARLGPRPRAVRAFGRRYAWLLCHFPRAWTSDSHQLEPPGRVSFSRAWTTQKVRFSRA